MKYINIIILTIAIFGCNNNPSPIHTAHKTHIVVLMGQSNMVGGNEIEVERQFNERILSLNLENEIDIAEDPLYFGISMYPELLNSNGVGPGVSFADEYIKSLPSHDDIILIPCARGASTMNEQINPYTTNMFGTEFERSLLDVCMERIDLVLNQTPNSTVDAVLYYQGESDLGNFNEWFNGLLYIKRTLEGTYYNMTFIFAQLSLNEEAPPLWDEFKEDQAHFAEQYNIPMVKTDDISTMYDHIHVDHESQIRIGKRFYQKFIETNR